MGVSMLLSQRVMLPRVGGILGMSENICHVIGLLKMICFIIEHTCRSLESAMRIEVPMGVPESGTTPEGSTSHRLLVSFFPGLRVWRGRAGMLHRLSCLYKASPAVPLGSADQKILSQRWLPFGYRITCKASI